MAISNQSSRVSITVYTDPLCVWSWESEGPWRRLQYEFADGLTWHTCMAGMISGWNQFADPCHNGSRPLQMGPLWMQAGHMTGMTVNDIIWVADPPDSSYPACIAVKAAACQSEAAAAAYLRRLREAVMLEQRNIARPEVLAALGDELGERDLLDADRFRVDQNGAAAQEAFRADLRDVRYRELARFPTLMMRHSDGRSLLLVGYRPYTELRAALTHLAPELTPLRTAENAVDYGTYWASITPSEVATALDCPLQDALEELDAAVYSGRLLRDGLVYRAPQARSVGSSR